MQKKFLLKAITASALVAGTIMQAEVVQAANVAPDPCSYTGSIECSGLIKGNDSVTNVRNYLKSVLPAIPDADNYNFIGKINFETDSVSEFNTQVDEGLAGSFGVTYGDLSTNATMGTWSVNSVSGPFALIAKAGPNFSVDWFDGTVNTGDWDTSLFGNKDISHFSLYASDNSTAIPTPALLPSFIGMGAIAWRKRKQKGESIDA